MKSNVRLLSSILMFDLLCSGASAQSKEQKEICTGKKSAVANVYCKALATEFGEKKIANHTYGADDLLLNPLAQPSLLTAAIFTNVYSKTLKANARTDAIQLAANDLAQILSTKAAVTQTGANASASGATNLVSKPTTTDLISLAAESGAFTETVNGTTLTAQTNVNGLRRYLSSKPFAELNPTTADILQHVTLAATFNVAQSGSTAAPTTGQATSSTPTNILSVLLPSNNVSFNSLNVSAVIYRPYSPTSSKFIKAWNDAIANGQPAIDSAAGQLYTDFQNTFPSQKAFFTKSTITASRDIWKTSAMSDEANGDFSHFVDDFLTYINAIVGELETDANFDQNLLTYVADLSKLQDVRNSVLSTARGSLATITYIYSAPSGKPATHNATAILGYVCSQRDAGAQFTVNVSGSWFATIPPGASYGRVRDYQFSGEFDQPIGKDRSSPRAVFSVAGYGQYQYTANILNVTVANVVPGTNISVPSNSQVFTSTPGWLGVAQTKFVFNIGKGATIPVAVKWSNKTDLLSDSNWKGQFGFSYDLSALPTILKGK
jgi:hypothetical protein